MQSSDSPQYRLNLAQGFLMEAREDIELERWRSCVDNCQLAVENAAKVALALLGPVARTHDPAKLIRKSLTAFSEQIRPKAERLAECAEILGPEVHARSDYGDDESLKTPWQIFNRVDAEQALLVAEEAVRIAKEVI